MLSKSFRAYILTSVCCAYQATCYQTVIHDGFVSSSLWFLRWFAEAPWIEGGTRISRREMDSLKVHAKYEEWVVRSSHLEGDVWKIKSLFLRGFRQRVRMTQNWQHFTNELILNLHDLSSFIYSKRGLKMKRELEGISNEKNFESGGHFYT